MIAILGLAGLASGATICVIGALWVRGYTGRHLGASAFSAGLALGIFGAAVALLSLDVIASGDAGQAERSLALPEQVYRGVGFAWLVSGVLLAWRRNSYLAYVTRKDPNAFREGLPARMPPNMRSALLLALALGMILGGIAFLI